jgi:hypothetical protein
MQVINLGELVYGEPKPKTPEERKAKHDGILATLNAPIYLGDFISLEYDVKSDRHAARFLPGEGKKLALKASLDVVHYLAQSITGKGYWLGRMEAGQLVDVYLIQA